MVNPARGGGTTVVPVREGDEAPVVEQQPAKSGGEVEGQGAKPTAESAESARGRATHDITAQQLRGIIKSQAAKNGAEPPPVESFQAGHLASQQVYQHGQGALKLAYREADRRARQGSPYNEFTVRHQGREIRYSDVRYRPQRNGYEASFRVRDGDTDMRYEMGERNGVFTARGRGDIALQGEEYNVDLNYRGSRSAEYDSTGGSRREQYAVTGSVATDDWRLALDEQYQLRTETADVRGAGHGTACSVSRTINNTLTQGGDTYRWQGVHTRGSFRSNRSGTLQASSPSSWSAEGNVTRNGQAYGRYELQNENGQLSIRLQTPDETVVLDHYRMRD